MMILKKNTEFYFFAHICGVCIWDEQLGLRLPPRWIGENVEKGYIDIRRPLSVSIVTANLYKDFALHESHNSLLTVVLSRPVFSFYCLPSPYIMFLTCKTSSNSSLFIQTILYGQWEWTGPVFTRKTKKMIYAAFRICSCGISLQNKKLGALRFIFFQITLNLHLSVNIGYKRKSGSHVVFDLSVHFKKNIY